MASLGVYWHEGMFLRPHHFQAAYRHTVDHNRRNHQWDVHYNWGLRSMDLDEDALRNHRLVIHALEARLRDGTPVIVPRDGLLPALDLRPVFQDKEARQFYIRLAVPALASGRRNLSVDPDARIRYYQDLAEMEDENNGGNPQPVPVRMLNMQLMAGNQDATGYETLRIARLEKSAQADAGPQLDLTYIPPLLSCDAWKPLSNGILRTLFDRLTIKIDWLVQQIATQGITFDRQAPGDALVLRQLQQLNEASATLGMIAAAPGVHPLSAFMELSRIVGQLAIFGATRRPPDLPRYDHDDLGTCFTDIKQYLDRQLDIVQEPEYKERPFIGAGLRMQVSLEPAWLDAAAQIFIGVQTKNLDAPQCVSLLTKAGQLDMKMGSSDHVDELFRQGAAGLRFLAEQLPPAALPKVPGQVYFQVMADPKNPEWVNVKNSLSLALRFNENLIVGGIQNQRSLTVKTQGRNVPIQFSLYVLPGKKT
ncbi:MAG: type VI secretion system baseplate subunit TssK [Planctomycetes bacterium]|nr:type VI secretion system baseplate subunit TssK [Planctomycetota bacterium]